MTKDELLTAVGRRIKLLREERGVSQQDLAAACNFEKSNMSRIEAGRNNLTLDTLLRIATALELPVREIVDV